MNAQYCNRSECAAEVSMTLEPFARVKQEVNEVHKQLTQQQR
jgi:hypothetical protein